MKWSWRLGYKQPVSQNFKLAKPAFGSNGSLLQSGEGALTVDELEIKEPFCVDSRGEGILVHLQFMLEGCLI